MEPSVPNSLTDQDIETVYISVTSSYSGESRAALADDNANEIDIEGQEDGGTD